MKLKVEYMIYFYDIYGYTETYIPISYNDLRIEYTQIWGTSDGHYSKHIEHVTMNRSSEMES